LIDQPIIETADASASEQRDPGARDRLRQMLRSATAAPHARLHLHPGFAAIQNGTIERGDYRALLVRLYGFHLAFEAAAGIASERSAWLREDLATLDLDDRALASVPRCSAPMTLDTPARRLGALYVVEGSSLGGRPLARSLEALLGPGARGRHFFLGRGADTSAAWHLFLERLASLLTSTPSAAQEAVAAAVASFGIFEEWMRDWKSVTQ
jgi:heme oxygenase